MDRTPLTNHNLYFVFFYFEKEKSHQVCMLGSKTLIMTQQREGNITLELEHVMINPPQRSWT